MSDDVCPHCQHGWSHHRDREFPFSRCEYPIVRGIDTGRGEKYAVRHELAGFCDCRWQEPVPPPPPPPPPTARELLNARVQDAIWEGFEDEDNACVDREIDLIDTGGHYEFSMERVAQHVIDKLGLTP